jgi:hypothetical protein
VEQDQFETMWRISKVAGAIDTTVKLLDTVIETLPAFKFRNVAGREIPIRELAGLARSVQAATSISQGRTFDDRDVQSLESRFDAVEAETRTMLAQLAKRE